MSGFLSLTLNNRYNENATSPGAEALNLYGLWSQKMKQYQYQTKRLLILNVKIAYMSENTQQEWK